MDREKEIREMLQVFCKNCSEVYCIKCKEINGVCDIYEFSANLLDNGYRKADDLIAENEKLKKKCNDYRRRARLFQGKADEVRKETAREIITSLFGAGPRDALTAFIRYRHSR